MTADKLVRSAFGLVDAEVAATELFAAIHATAAAVFEGGDRTRWVGLGPLIGGAVIGAGLGWRAIFWVSVPVGLVGVILAARFVPESKAPHPRRVDPVGQVLMIVLFAAVVSGVIEGPRSGWASPLVAGCFALAAVAVAGVLVYEPRRREPVLELRFFRSLPFSGAAVISWCAFAEFGGFLWVNTLYLQDVRGYSALHAGLLIVPMGAMTAIVGPPSGRLVARHGTRFPLLVAGVTLFLAAIMLTGLTATTSVGWLIVSYAIFGLGFAMVSAPTNTTALDGMPAAQAGVAASITSTSRQVGQSFGVAIAGSIVASGLHGPLRTGLTQASRPGWWVLAGFGAMVVLLGIVTTSPWARRTAATTAASLNPRPTGQTETDTGVGHRCSEHQAVAAGHDRR